MFIFEQGALKEMLGYWKAVLVWKVVWKCARTMDGEQCVMMGGVKVMPQSCVVNLGFL